MDPAPDPPPALAVGDGAALRLAVVLSAAKGALSPVDLAAVERAFCTFGLAEDAAEAAVRASLPLLADPTTRDDPTAVPFGATSWRAVHRRAHDPDARLAIAADVGFHVDSAGTLYTWGTNDHGLLGDAAGIHGDRPDHPHPHPSHDPSTAPRVSFPRLHPALDRGRRRRAPRPILPSVRVVGVSVGGHHAVAVDDAGAVWTWGRARNGQLGRPTAPPKTQTRARGDTTADADAEAEDAANDAEYDARPARVPGFGGFRGDERELGSRELGSRDVDEPGPGLVFVVSASAGHGHTAVVDAGGTAWCWGMNASGQLGVARTRATTVRRPRKVRRLERVGAKVVSAAAARHRTLFLDERGRVFVAFCNAYSVGVAAAEGEDARERATEKENDRVSDEDDSDEDDSDVDSDFDSDDDSVADVDSRTAPTQPHNPRSLRSRRRRLARNPRLLRGAPPAVHVSMTWEHAVMIDRAGDAWSWGIGGNGRTGLGHERVAVRPAGPLRRGALAGAPRLARARTSKEHSLVVAADGRLAGFGRGADGELDAAGASDALVPTWIAAPPRVGAIGGGATGGIGAKVSAVACGSVLPGRFSAARGASAAIRAEDGRVYAWGAPRPWLGRGDDEDAWAPGSEPGAIRFRPHE